MEPLRDPRYRRVLAASTLSWIGLWLCNIAVIAGLLGAGSRVMDIGAFQTAWTLGVPVAVVAGGLLVDRLGPTPVVVAGLVVEAIAIGLMGIVFVGGRAELPMLLLVAIAVGSADGLCAVAFNVLAGGVVARRLMASAIGLLLISIAAARIVGGTVAGPLVDALGTSLAIIASAGVVLIGAVLALSVGPVRFADSPVAASYLDIRPGVRLYRSQPDAITTLALGGIVALLVLGYFSLLPIVVGETLGTDASAQGLALALGGVGVALAAVSIGPVTRHIGGGRLLVIAVVGSGLAMVVLSLGTSTLAVALVAMLLPVFTNVHGATSNAILQGLAPGGIRGRVVGLYALLFALLLPVGIFLAGWLGERLGVRATLAGLGLGTVALCALLVVLRPGLLRLGREPATPAQGVEVVVGIEPGAR